MSRTIFLDLHSFYLSSKFHLLELSRERERAANDNIFGRAWFPQWDLQVTSSFSIITKYMGRDPLFRTMHSAYINNQGTFLLFFFLFFSSALCPGRVYSRPHSAGMPLKISGNFPSANLESTHLPFLSFLANRRKKNQLIFFRAFTSRTQSRWRSLRFIR